MKIAFYDTHDFERDIFIESNKKFGHELHFLQTRLHSETATLSAGHDVVCAFTNDSLDAMTLVKLKELGIGFVALRSAGFNNVDLNVAKELGIRVARVPEYSPYSIAEHSVGLILCLNRKIHRSYNRVREGNFSLNGLVGFDLHGKTIGVIGAGRIGEAFARIVHGFGMEVIAYDQHPRHELEQICKYVELNELLKRSDIVSLHVPLNSSTKYLINQESLKLMKRGAMLINTGRGGLIDTKALINALKEGRIGAAGLDVYEEEEGVFFHDLSGDFLTDDVLARLMSFPNVLITGHQGFLTHEALHNIAVTTLQNITDYEKRNPIMNNLCI